MVARRGYKGGARQTTLVGDINDSALTIPGADFSTWSGAATTGPATGTFNLGESDEEEFTFTGISGGSLIGVTRGTGGTTQQAHSSGVTLDHTSSVTDFDEANAHIADTALDHHTQYLLRSLEGRLWANNYGTVGDGTTDDRAAIAAADTAAALVSKQVAFGPGAYKIATDLTITSPVTMEAGATLVIPTGVTVTLNGPFVAPVQQVFDCAGTGQVVFGSGTIETGRCEWWGAASGGPDCHAALTAAIIACPTVELFGADYFISTTLLMQLPHRTLRGHSTHYASSSSPATRLIVQSGSLPTITIAAAVDPGTVVNDFLSDVHVENLDVTRTVAPVPNSAGNEATGPVGILIQKSIRTFLTRVYANEHSVGFCLNGTVQTHITECHAFRSLLGTGANTANDTFWGFYFNGDADIGLAGGNASSFLTDCNTSVGGAPALVESVGFRLTTSFVDTFLLRPEVSACDFGIYATGTRTGSADAQQKGNVDLHIVGPTIDQFNSFGIYLKDLSKYGAVTIAGGYAAPAAGTAALQVDLCEGMVNVTDFQAICWPFPACIGLFVTSSRGVTCKNMQIVGSARPVVLEGSVHCRIAPVINTPLETPTDAAVYLSNTGGGNSRNYIAPNVIAAGAVLFPQGVNLAGAANAYNEINCTLIEPSAITGGAANKLVINGVQVVATGLSGTNLASGVMA